MLMRFFRRHQAWITHSVAWLGIVCLALFAFMSDRLPSEHIHEFTAPISVSSTSTAQDGQAQDTERAPAPPALDHASTATADEAVAHVETNTDIRTNVTRMPEHTGEVSTESASAPAAPPDLSRYDKVEVIATGYSAGYESTGKTPDHPQYGITYSGLKVRRDHLSTIAADPEVFPLGTVLWIPGYGYGMVADTGSAIKGNKIDLYFETVEDVFREWGKKTVDVYVIEKGDGRVTETMFHEMLQTYKS